MSERPLIARVVTSADWMEAFHRVWEAMFGRIAADFAPPMQHLGWPKRRDLCMWYAGRCIDENDDWELAAAWFTLGADPGGSAWRTTERQKTYAPVLAALARAIVADPTSSMTRTSPRRLALPRRGRRRRRGRPDPDGAALRRHDDDRQVTPPDLGARMAAGDAMMRVIKRRRCRTRRRLRRQRKILRAFTHATLTKEEATCKLGLRDDAELLGVLGAFGVPQPRLPDAATARMADEFVKVWRN